MQAPGFTQPIDALLAVATCLGDLTISNQAGDALLSPRVFLGDSEVGGVIDCCSGDCSPILRIESTGENPTNGVPVTLGKHGCVELSMGIRVTFLTCFRTISKAGTVVTDPDDLAYSQVVQQSRWDALTEIRCCGAPQIQYESSTPIGSDGKCSGWSINLRAAMTMCQCPTG